MTGTSDTTPFGELTDATQGELLLAHRRQENVEWSHGNGSLARHSDGSLAPWQPVEPGYDLHDNRIYRVNTEGTQDQIPWEHIDKKFRYAVRFGDGEGHVFSEIPHKYREEWCMNSHHESYQRCLTGFFSGYKAGTRNWRGSLQKRPEVKS